ncbi:hypothetical protein DXT74_08585 [Chromobacterium sp. Rain0013]|nr:hypothetical protein DXT74_08585 [Chromobacterium sp. Rain0013]
MLAFPCALHTRVYDLASQGGTRRKRLRERAQEHFRAVLTVGRLTTRSSKIPMPTRFMAIDARVIPGAVRAGACFTLFYQ